MTANDWVTVVYRVPTDEQRTADMGFLVGLDVETSAVCIIVPWFRLDVILLDFKFLTCTFISLLGFGSLAGR